MVFDIQQVGDADWPRFALTARIAETIQFWSGAVWTRDLQNARLFAFLPDACREFERLQTQRLSAKRVQEFEATVKVKLHADSQINQRELANFLDRFAELFLPTEGPRAESIVQAEIHWQALHEITPQDSSE